MPARVLLLHGDEQFLVQEEATRVLEAWKKDLVSDFGFEGLEPAGLTPGRLREAVGQAPFLDPYRVVSVRGLQPARADAFATAVEVPDTTRLLITVAGRLGPASKLAKAVTGISGGEMKEHARLRGARKLQEWTSERARQLGLSPVVAAQVVRVTPGDLGVIDSELRKLAAYQQTGNALDNDTLRQLLAGGREEDIFRLTDNLLPRPTAGAWAVAQGLVDAGMGPTLIAYRLARHLAMILEVKTRQERGESLAQIQTAMREHPFVVQKAFDAAQSTSVENLERSLSSILAYEWEVKSGQVDADLGLQVLLTRL